MAPQCAALSGAEARRPLRLPSQSRGRRQRARRIRLRLEWPRSAVRSRARSLPTVARRARRSSALAELRRGTCRDRGRRARRGDGESRRQRRARGHAYAECGSARDSRRDLEQVARGSPRRRARSARSREGRSVPGGVHRHVGNPGPEHARGRVGRDDADLASRRPQCHRQLHPHANGAGRVVRGRSSSRRRNWGSPSATRLPTSKATTPWPRRWSSRDSCSRNSCVPRMSSVRGSRRSIGRRSTRRHQGELASRSS